MLKWMVVWNLHHGGNQYNLATNTFELDEEASVKHFHHENDAHRWAEEKVRKGITHVRIYALKYTANIGNVIFMEQ